MIDFVLRLCSDQLYLVLIVETETGRELYRGSRFQSAEAALERALTCWRDNGTGNIYDFKQKTGQL